MNNKQKTRDKRKLIAGFTGAALVILGMAAYFMSAGPYSLSELLMMPVLLVLVVGAIIIFFRKYKSYKAGLPGEDEMSRKLSYKAGAYAYYATIYIALAIGFISDDVPITVSQATGAIILMSAIVFIGSFLILSRRGSA